jgi:hypothetical protein
LECGASAPLFFFGHHEKPLQTFDGDGVFVSAEFVHIMKKIPTNREKEVAAIKLAEGQCVKEISE